MRSNRFKGVHLQPNGLWGAWFYAKGCKIVATKNEDLEELAAFELWAKVEAYAEENPTHTVRYTNPRSKLRRRPFKD